MSRELSDSPTPLQRSRAYLYSKGWTERSCAGPWRWSMKKLPGVHYTFHDAVELQRSMDKRQTEPRKR